MEREVGHVAYLETKVHVGDIGSHNGPKRALRDGVGRVLQVSGEVGTSNDSWYDDNNDIDDDDDKDDDYDYDEPDDSLWLSCSPVTAVKKTPKAPMKLGSGSSVLGVKLGLKFSLAVSMLQPV